MTKYSIVGALVAIGLAVSLTSAVADGPGAGYAVVKVGTVSFIDRALNLFQLEDGTELRVSDPRMLQDLSEGELVKVDFTTSGSWTPIGSQKMPTRDVAGTASRRSCSRRRPRSGGPRMWKPVTLPPGRFRLATTPV